MADRIVIERSDPRIAKLLDLWLDPADDYDLLRDGYTRAEVEEALWAWLGEQAMALLDDPVSTENGLPSVWDRLPRRRTGGESG